MSREREDLIDLITERILDALRRGKGAAAAGDGAAPPARAEASPRARDGGAPHESETAERYRLFGVSTSRGPEDTRTLHEAGAGRVVTTLGYCPAADGLASLIDHTLLKPDATKDQIEQLCREAAQFCFASVCVNPVWVP